MDKATFDTTNAMLKSRRYDLAQAKERVMDAERILKAHEARFLLQVSCVRDSDTGKPKYGNEDTRKAAVLVEAEENEVWHTEYQDAATARIAYATIEADVQYYCYELARGTLELD